MGQTNWTSLGQPDGTIKVYWPQVFQNADGRLEVFAPGLDDNLWHIWQTAPGNGWGTWFSSSKPASIFGLDGQALCVASNPDGRLEVLVRGTDEALWQVWQLTPNGTWSSWTSLGPPPNTYATNLGSGTNADGRIEVFTIGKDGNLWHIWQTAPGGSWSSWFSSGKPASGLEAFLDLTVSRNVDGRLEVFVPGNDGLVYHIWQQTPGGTWGGWYSLGSPQGAQFNSTPRVIANADGRLEAFITTTDGALWHTWQVTPGGEWGS